MVSWWIAGQIGALLIIVGAIGLKPPTVASGPFRLLASPARSASPPQLSTTSAGAWAAPVLTDPSGYAASIGLAFGCLATPQGSVATLIATDLAGPGRTDRNQPPPRLLAALALVAATLLLAAGA
jgi:hypothetical protein